MTKEGASLWGVLRVEEVPLLARSGGRLLPELIDEISMGAADDKGSVRKKVAGRVGAVGDKGEDL